MKTSQDHVHYWSCLPGRGRKMKGGVCEAHPRERSVRSRAGPGENGGRECAGGKTRKSFREGVEFGFTVRVGGI